MTEPGGAWLLNEVTGELTHVETHPGSTIASQWPAGDRESLYAIQRGCDWLLNAAGAGFEAYRAALRARWPGDARGLTTDSKPWQFWHRTLWGLSGGATRRLFMGDLDRATRVNGFTIDDSKDGDTVTGWSGGTSSTNLTTLNGSGPGRGLATVQATSEAAAGGGGGGAAQAGSDAVGSVGGRGRGGPSVTPYHVLHAVITNNYARERWLATGGGGRGRSGTNPDGGDSGGGLLRVALNDLVESSNRTLTGEASADNFGTNRASGGGGGGGVYLAICGGNYTLDAGTTINCGGGSAGSTSNSNARQGGAGGNGHIIIMAGGDITFAGASRRANAVTTQWRIIAAPPPGGSFVTNP